MNERLLFLLNQKGTVRLLFQPAEEGGAGAFHMIKEGALGDSEAIFGMHVHTGLPTGELATILGPAMASTSIFSVRVSGILPASSETYACVDPVLAASSTILALQLIVSREVDPLLSHVCCLLFHSIKLTVVYAYRSYYFAIPNLKSF